MTRTRGLKWARQRVGADTTAHIVDAGARGAKPVKRRGHDEDAIQAAVCLHLSVRAVPGLVWWHTPNGGTRGAAEAGRFKALGVKAGVPDLIAIHNGRVFGLELKAPGGRVSPAQYDMLAQSERRRCRDGRRLRARRRARYFGALGRVASSRSSAIAPVNR